MKKFYFLLLVFTAIMLNVQAERINIPGLELPKIIITEVRSDAESTAYVEITNMGDSAVNLEPFTLFSVHYNTRCTEYSDSAISFNRGNAATDGTIGKIYLKGVLQPGESHVVATVWDAENSRKSGIPNHNTAIAQIGKQFAHKSEINNLNGWINKPEWQCFGMDSISSPIELLRAEVTSGYLIHWKFEKEDGTIDSTFIDQFNHFWYPDVNTEAGLNPSLKGYSEFPIAGVVDAKQSSVLVRKSNINKGNLNWDQSRGTDAVTSEWLVIPKNTSKDMAFTTVASHGLFDLDFTVKDPSLIILNDANNTISVPWQIVRGDSLARYFNLGNGMSWQYTQNPIFEDSASYIVRNDDKFTFYAVGTEVKSKEYTIIARQPDASIAMVFPKRQLMSRASSTPEDGTGVSDTVYQNYWSNNFVYGLSSGGGVDSIINVPFATRTDSLLKYLDKPEKATWEFIFVDGQERVDLKFGDILKVTSEDKTNTKEYFISVSDYVAGNNALLSTVLWPDIDFKKYPRWINGDTLAEFTPFKTLYTIELAYDAKNIPALQFKTQDARAKIKVKNAVSVNGNLDQRTTSVTVTSESDTISLTYNFVFQKQGIPAQPNIAEPFFSEFIQGVNTQGYAIEIFNPGTEELNLSRYCVVRGTSSQSWQEAVETCLEPSSEPFFISKGDGSKKPYQTHYFPSKRWRNDGSIDEWNATPTVDEPYLGKGWLIDDNQTDPYVKGGDVFVMGTGIKDPGVYASQDKIIEECDFIFRGRKPDNTEEAWPGYVIYHQATPVWTRNYLYLLKVTNDSILDGTKNVRDASGYELIDLFVLNGDSVAGIPSKGQMNLVRKPSVSKGTLERAGGGLETAESSQWIATTSGSGLYSNLGVHVMDPRTDYKSTVTSLVLIVSPGYSGDNLTIRGSITSYTPTTISLVLDKADSTQTFVFKRGANILGADDVLADGDILEVTAGNGVSKSNYKLVNSPLDDDTSLVAKDGSGLTVTGNKVTGIEVGMTLKDALAKLEIADKSILNIYNADGTLQPLRMYNLDSLVFDVLVSEDIILEVVAENNDKATYNFDFGLADNDAILLSSTLEIDQEKKLVVSVPTRITTPTFMNLLFVNKGASYKLLDKAGFERTMGLVSYDDVVEVTAPDGITKVVYTLNEAITTIGVIEYNNGSAISFDLFPNPVSTELNISGVDVSAVKIYALTGVMMISEYNMFNNKIDVSNLTKGVYIIEVTDKKGRTATNKFLKK